MGDGPDFIKVKKYISENDHTESIVLYGALSGHKLNEVLAQANLAIISHTLWFHGPVKLFQYYSASLPVLAFDTPTIRYLTKGSSSIQHFSSNKELKMILESFVIDDIKTIAEEPRDYYEKNFSEESFRALVDEIEKFTD